MEGHSAAFFGPVRDFWWNLDHLDLCARRLGFDRVHSMLDVGAGVGHWGRLLSRVLPDEVECVGVDPEPRWVEEATRRAAEEGLGERFTYREASAEALPFDDASFDLVTCQTVLIHVADPRVAIREMLRVTKPGGLVVASEPNNRSLTLMLTSANTGTSVDELCDLVRFYTTCERGKVALGLGQDSVGDLVPGLFAEAGLEGIQTYLSDKVSMMIPPYDSDEQQALKEMFLREAEQGSWGWSGEDAKSYYVAGGGDEAEFDESWERRLRDSRRDAAAIEDGSYHFAGGSILYLVAGTKPA